MENQADGVAEGRVSAPIEFRASSIHGRGGFARRFIPGGIRVIEYVGRRISKEESLQLCEANNHYIFGVDDTTDLDGDVEWNSARLLNHSCSPNCEAVLDQGRVWICSLRDIAPGEELTFNYGYDLIDFEDYPCHCGAPECVGYMVAEEHFGQVRRQREGRRL